MFALDCPIPKQNWVQGVKAANGAVVPPAGKLTDEKTKDAGPWEPAVQKTVGFLHLGEDWDGQGAIAPARELLESAVGLAYTLLDQGMPPPSRVVPGLEGSVIFEWQFPDGTYADVEVVRPLFAEVMVIEPGVPPKHWTLPTP